MRASLFSILLLATSSAFATKPFNFGGIAWEARDGFGSPGPNHWSSDNVEITPEGLKFAITKQPDGKWHGAYAISMQWFLYGTFRMTISTNYDAVDDLLVFSPYLYPFAGDDRTQEIDIVEFSRWGEAGAPLLQFTQYPVDAKLEHRVYRGHVRPGTRDITVQLVWTPKRVEFSSSQGHKLVITDPRFISTIPMPLQFNIRYMRGVPAKPDAKDFSVTIRDLKYTPL